MRSPRRSLLVGVLAGVTLVGGLGPSLPRATATEPSPAASPTPTPLPLTPETSGAAAIRTPAPQIVAASPTPTPSPSPSATASASASASTSPSPSASSSPSPTPTPTPAPGGLPAGVTPLPASVTFHGRGYGHGVGLSQYGARGRALAGQTAPAILAHYYAGTAIGSIDPATPIRVRLLSGFTASSSTPLVVYGRGGTWTVDGIATAFPADARLALTPTVSTTSVTWRLRITSSSGSVLHDAASTGRFRIRPAASATRLQLFSKPSQYDTYRGVLAVAASSTSARVNVTNELGIDAYLLGVVPAEMPSSWPTEALRAQAIAARSYAAYRLRPTSTFDVYDDTRSQVYRGVEAETTAGSAAVRATAGLIVTSGGAVANTLFHSTGGGATEHNENVFVSSTGAIVSGPVSYLRGSSDRAPDGASYDAAAPYATWRTATYTSSQVSSWFAADARTNVGTLLGLDLRARGVSGRLVKVVLYGTTGSKTVSGDVFRAIFNARRPAGDPPVRSSLFALQPIP